MRPFSAPAFRCLLCLLLLGCGGLLTRPAVGQTVRQHWIRVADSKMYVEESGQGPALLLLHGGLLDHRQWAPQVKAWSRHFRVLNCDLRKHGLTQDGDSTFLSSDGLVRVLDSLGVPKAYVLGHSLGGVAALDLALAHPERVSRLVLAAPGLIGYDLDRDSVLARNGRQENAARQRHDTLAYAEYFVRSWIDGPPPPAHPNAARRAHPGPAAGTRKPHPPPVGHPTKIRLRANPTPAPGLGAGPHAGAGGQR